MSAPAAPFNGGVPNGRAAGILIAACATLTVVAISHHPVVTAREPSEALAQMVRMGAADRIVHGVVIVFVGVLLFGFSIYSLRRGLHRQTVVAALVAYAAGIAAMVVAALVDGFLIPAIAARYAGAPPDAIRLAGQFLAICAMAIQILAKFGVIALTTAVVL
ncbi:MAG TPA: hypothetical protein VN224_05000, partial [Xanthomonadales bacterium]|nr:hypothetical protein [Xanthomonadales bacterium]